MNEFTSSLQADASRKGYDVNFVNNTIIEVRPKGTATYLNMLNRSINGMKKEHNNQKTFARLSKQHARSMQHTKPVPSFYNKKKARNVIKRAVSSRMPSFEDTPKNASQRQLSNLRKRAAEAASKSKRRVTQNTIDWYKMHYRQGVNPYTMSLS